MNQIKMNHNLMNYNQMKQLQTKVKLFGDPSYAIVYKKSKTSSRWVALDLMQLRPDPRHDMSEGKEYDALLVKDNRGMKYVFVGDVRYRYVR